MTELTIRPEEIRDAIERNVAAYSPSTAREEVGRVTEIGDGIARVEGLHSAMTNELLEFEGGLLGVALNLDIRWVTRSMVWVRSRPRIAGRWRCKHQPSSSVSR
jgi:F0F1-type ATP synthase alpha subunit